MIAVASCIGFDVLLCAAVCCAPVFFFFFCETTSHPHTSRTPAAPCCTRQLRYCSRSGGPVRELHRTCTMPEERSSETVHLCPRAKCIAGYGAMQHTNSTGVAAAERGTAAVPAAGAHSRSSTSAGIYHDRRQRRERCGSRNRHRACSHPFFLPLWPLAVSVKGASTDPGSA